MKQYSLLATDKAIQRIGFTLDEVTNKAHLLYTVSLNDQSELTLLFEVFSLQVNEVIGVTCEFGSVKSFDQDSRFTQNAFDEKYKHWLSESSRENTMDEYGQLVFLTDQVFFNKKYKYLLEE